MIPYEHVEKIKNKLILNGIDIPFKDIQVLCNKYEEHKVLSNAESCLFDNKLKDWYDGKRKITNVNKFLTARNNYERTGKYTTAFNSKHPSSEYVKFWKEEINRCQYGHLVDDDWITGYHYFYLNYCQIELVQEIFEDGQTFITRGVDFPAFWDGDYYLFHYIEEAKRLGKHCLILKKRGAGMSWKFAAMLNRNYHCFASSRSQAYAPSKEYLLGDGVLSKAWSIMSFIDNNTELKKKRQLKNTEMHRQSGFKVKKDDGSLVDTGWFSEILGTTLKDDPHKIRGKRSMLIGFEEFGSQDDGDQAWDISTPSVEAGQGKKKQVFGQKVAFGCITAGNMVWTADGRYIDIKDIEQNDGILGFNRTTGCVSKETISYIKDITIKPCYKLITSTGRTLEASDDHPVLWSKLGLGEVVSHTKNKIRVRKWLGKTAEFKNMKDIRIGEQVGICETIDVFNNRQMFDARLVGLLIGDGSYSYNSSPTLSNCDIEVWNYVKSKYTTSLEISFLTKENKVFETNRILNITKELRELGIFGQTKDKKRLPLNIHDYCKNDICDLLGGLIDTDGSVVYNKKTNKGTVTITSMSKELLLQIQSLYGRIGVHGCIVDIKPSYRIREYKGKIIKDENIYYRLEISNYTSLVNLRNNIQLLIKYKSDKLDYLIEVCKTNKERRSNTIKGIIFEKVIDIQYVGEKEVYNLTADITHTYIANGIITHNTGGETGSTFESMKKMIYAPENYDILSVPNMWDKGRADQRVAYFIPAYINLAGYIDNDGNSDIQQAKLAIDEEREKWNTSNVDSVRLARLKAEMPLTIQEAILRTEGNMFPVAELKEQLATVQTKSELRDNKSIGKLLLTSSFEVRFELAPKGSLTPLETLEPLEGVQDGAIVIYEHPIKREKDGLVPEGRYIGCTDPIDFGALEVGIKHSLGATYIMDTWTENIVANYIARPEDVNDFYETTRRLALYYNCKIMYENNLKGLYTYFVNKNSEWLLADEPKLLKDKLDIKSVSNRKKGFTASEKVLQYGRLRIKNWLLKEYVNDNTKLNLHNIRDIGLLEELISWHKDGNFDRVSAIIGAMLYLDEIERYISVSSESINCITRCDMFKNVLNNRYATLYTNVNNFNKLMKNV